MPARSFYETQPEKGYKKTISLVFLSMCIYVLISQTASILYSFIGLALFPPTPLLSLIISDISVLTGMAAAAIILLLIKSPAKAFNYSNKMSAKEVFLWFLAILGIAACLSIVSSSIDAIIKNIFGLSDYSSIDAMLRGVPFLWQVLLVAVFPGNR